MELAIAIAANVVLGVLLLGLFLWRGTTDGARLAGAAEALRLFRAHFPDAVVETATLAGDARGALIALRHDPAIGLIQRHGRRWNVRALEAEDLRSVAFVRGNTLRLELADFAWPRVDLCLEDAQERGRWRARFADLTAVRDTRRLLVAPHA
ncbi:MAG: hypothetical protein WA747_12855 [Steroidobacteraceae bacterium]